MKIVFDTYAAEEDIPVQKYLKNKKLKKYFNKETSASIIGVAKLTADEILDSETPFYFALGEIEYEDYGLKDIVQGSRDDKNQFSNKLFVEKGLPNVSPLNQFKVLQNMPLSFVAIEFSLTGDNAVVYKSASALLLHALHSPSNGIILLGATKAYHDGKVNAGFVLITKQEIEKSCFLSYHGDAIEMFEAWNREGRIV